MTATLDRISDGRLLINVVTGGDPVENKGDGIFLSHDERYEVTREFLDVYSDLLAGETVNVDGKHIRIEDGRLLFPPVQSPHPPLYFGGSSDAGIDVAADTRRQIPDLGRAAGAGRGEDRARDGRRRRNAGRKLSLRHPPARHRARDQCRSLGGGRRPHPACRRRDGAPARRRSSRASDSVGQKRMAQLHGGRRDKLEISPNLWAGVGLVRGGAGTALVGDPETVAARIEEYQDDRHRYLHPVRLSASRRGLPFRRAGVPAAAAGSSRAMSRGFASTPARSARPSATTYRPQTQVSAVMSLIESLPRVRCASPAARPTASSQWIAAAWHHRRSGRLPRARASCRRACCRRRATWRSRAGSSRDRGELLTNIWVSFWRAVVGFLIGGGIGFAFGAGQRPVAAVEQAHSTRRCRWCATCRIWR